MSGGRASAIAARASAIAARASAIVTLAALLTSACASAPPPDQDPVAPSSHRDPRPHLPRPEPAARTGELVGIAAGGGEDQARALLVSMVSAVRDGDVDTVASLFSPQVLHFAALRLGRARTSQDATIAARQLVLAARAAQLRSDLRFDEIVEPSSIEIAPATDLFPAGLPADLRSGDLVVRFRFTSLSRRAFGGMTDEGRAAIVVRPGEDARIVAR